MPAILDYEILSTGYDIHRRDRGKEKRGGGVLIAVKSDIHATRWSDLETNCELVAVEVMPTRGSKFLVGSYYHPPAAKADYLMELKNFLNAAECESTPLYLCGDINLPDINWDYHLAPGFDNVNSLFSEIIHASYSIQMNLAPARIHNNTSNILDLVFTNQPDRISDISTFDSQLTTDHLGVHFIGERSRLTEL